MCSSTKLGILIKQHAEVSISISSQQYHGQRPYNVEMVTLLWEHIADSSLDMVTSIKFSPVQNAGCLGEGRSIASFTNIETTSDMVSLSTALS